MITKHIYIHGQQENPAVTHIDFPTDEKHIRIRGLLEAEETLPQILALV